MSKDVRNLYGNIRTIVIKENILITHMNNAFGKAQVLEYMRDNSRERLVRISRKHSRPLKEVMKLYDELRPVILKHTSLMQHGRFGRRYYMVINADTSTRNFILLKNFLKVNSCVNNAYVYEYGMTMEVIFPRRKLRKFLEELRRFRIDSIKCHEILEILFQERFCSKDGHV